VVGQVVEQRSGGEAACDADERGGGMVGAPRMTRTRKEVVGERASVVAGSTWA
jgi:hypothetical protein